MYSSSDSPAFFGASLGTRAGFSGLAYGIPLSDITTWQDLLALPQQFEARRQHRAPECNDCLSTRVFDKFAPRRSSPGCSDRASAATLQGSSTFRGSRRGGRLY